MRENVLALEVVTASGEVIRTGTRAKKSSAGYDLTRLMVGSEGTLGVITEITLRIYPLPEAVSAAICSFPSIEAAVRTTIEMIQLGVPIARVELIDRNTVRMVNAYSKLGLREEPMLLMEFHGSPAGVKEQAETVQELASGHGGNAFEWASTPEERTRLWTARHNAYFAAMQSRPGCRAISTDTCVPISRLADCLLESVAEADASGIPYFLVGHVGDGNFHFGYLLDPNDAEERATAEELNHALVIARASRSKAPAPASTASGLHKMGFLVDEAGAGAVDMMRTIKRALDPKNIMNPGKIFTSDRRQRGTSPTDPTPRLGRCCGGRPSWAARPAAEALIASGCGAARRRRARRGAEVCDGAAAAVHARAGRRRRRPWPCTACAL